jgi:hypothetical protein
VNPARVDGERIGEGPSRKTSQGDQWHEFRGPEKPVRSEPRGFGESKDR